MISLDSGRAIARNPKKAKRLPGEFASNAKYLFGDCQEFLFLVRSHSETAG